MNSKYSVKIILLMLVLISACPILGSDEIISKTGNWGYGYNDLLNDLPIWSASPWVTIDSIGASVQDRALWELTITDTTVPDQPRRTIYMHVRTHPNEVQSFWVANEFINLLISDDSYATFMRQQCTFYIIPMYNPDGVELGYARENANGIDIESNWANIPMEPEPAILKQRFTDLMQSAAPIEVALNMHSAYSAALRFFVYHHENGTSVEYTLLEKQFIGAIQTHFPTGIAPWDHTVTWTSFTPDYYPESWFWLNYGTAVMALTYEDMNNDQAGNYDSTAYALLHGIGDYLDLHPAGVDHSDFQPMAFQLNQNYPNPFNPVTTISYIINEKSPVVLDVYNLQGQLVNRLVNGSQTAGTHTIQWNATDQPSGVYLYRLTIDGRSITRKMTVIK